MTEMRIAMGRVWTKDAWEKHRKKVIKAWDKMCRKHDKWLKKHGRTGGNDEWRVIRHVLPEGEGFDSNKIHDDDVYCKSLIDSALETNQADGLSSIQDRDSTFLVPARMYVDFIDKRVEGGWIVMHPNLEPNINIKPVDDLDVIIRIVGQ